MWLGYNAGQVAIAKSALMIVKFDKLSTYHQSMNRLRRWLLFIKIAEYVAKNCNQQQIIATYNLAIAKLAMQIQHTKKPEFDDDDIFINLGAFHTQMAFFKVIGKYIDSSGLTEILVEAEVLAGGSMNSFLDS